jgi:hypothetical protein
MRQLFVATLALLVLSGCQTSGYNPLKLESDDNLRPAAGGERLLNLLIGRTD